MKRKDLLNLIFKMKETAIQEMYAVTGANSGSSRKRVKRLIKDFRDAGWISYDDSTGEIHAQKLPKLPKKEKAPHSTVTKGGTGKKAASPRRVEAKHDLKQVLDKYHIRHHYPEPILKELENVPHSIPPEEIARRLDLRKDLIFTIDGVDAKDLDDAISLTKEGNDWILGVHIADVSYYVPAHSRLDKEALRRGNSYYFIDTAIPMFPELLSNRLCSLNPQEDKLTVSAIMRITPNLEIASFEIRETVINTRRRLNYDSVQRFFLGEETLDYPELEKNLTEMRALSRALYRKRLQEGGLDFNFKEQKIELDEKGEPVRVWLKDRLESEQLIEEFMLTANKTVAKYLAEMGISIYRVHEEPSSEKLRDFVRIAMRFGHKIYGVPVPSPHELQKVLKEAEDQTHKEFVSQILLRSMAQARYTPENLGHYGLGFEFYTHFTSPIRRYADLIVHRLIKSALHHQYKQLEYTLDDLEDIAQQASATERIAMEAEREFYKIKSVRFMKGYEKKTFDGVVTGVSPFGIFVQISKTGIEGLCRFMDMADDYYTYYEGEFTAKGRKTQNSYTLGDKVKVQVLRVNVARTFIDLEFVND